VRDEFSIIEAACSSSAPNEVVVGRGAVVNFQGLTVGSTIHSGQNTWQVVGSSRPTQRRRDRDLVRLTQCCRASTAAVNSYQTVLAQLDSSESFRQVPRLADVEPASQRAGPARDRILRAAVRALSSLIRTIGFGIAALMGIGAVFGAI
jgi:putative ABC transport system permease protein